MSERLENSFAYKWDYYSEKGGFDFLYNSREIFREIYEEVDMPLPRYFPEKKYNDDSESNKENWKNLYLGSKSDFIYDEVTGHLYYNIKNLMRTISTMEQVQHKFMQMHCLKKFVSTAFMVQ